MEVSAIAFFRLASVEHVALSPSGAGLVVLHSREDVVIDSPRLVERIGLPLRYFDRKVCWYAGDRNERLGLQIFRPHFRIKSSLHYARRGIQRDAFMPHYVILHVKMEFGWCW